MLWEFARLADARGEHQRAEKWRLHVSALKASLEREGWDGEWYRRAYFDDGTALGSAGNAECRIDSIAQSWGVLSGAAEPARGARAMAAVEKHLVRRAEGLVLLFSPPFDQASPDPGYIKGYPPGIRENGGQYTHAAIWSVLAFAALGEGDKAGETFLALESDQSREYPRRRFPVQSRALRRRRRYLFRATARRPRRLDLVHGLGGLDVSCRHRMDPGISFARHGSPFRSVHTARVAKL